MPSPGARLVLTVDPALYDRLSARSQATKTPMRTLIRQALADKLDRDEIAGQAPEMKEAAE